MRCNGSALGEVGLGSIEAMRGCECSGEGTTALDRVGRVKKMLGLIANLFITANTSREIRQIRLLPHGSKLSKISV